MLVYLFACSFTNVGKNLHNSDAHSRIDDKPSEFYIKIQTAEFKPTLSLT